jgi:hypothetical protein
MSVPAGVLSGLAAGAAATTALNTVTYLDMAIRGRPTSTTPELTVERLADRVGVTIPGGPDDRPNRVAGLGALSGMAAGIGLGGLLGALRGAGWRPGVGADLAATTAGALLVGNGPMTVLGITDPRTWTRTDWLSDLVPHAAYGVVATAVARALARS